MNARVEELFHEVADLTPEARREYFAARGVDADTRGEVEALLAFDPGASGYLLRGVGIAASRSLPRMRAEGRRCGAYRLLELIGRGGMGAVYVAERADGEVTHRAAVKLLRYGGDEPAFRDRFLRERQILATLNHPGIARLLDAGHTEDGQPYLAMEYIEGVSIDAYSRSLDPSKKLDLFLRICEAVAYAHRNLVVHRDIKPSNILVDAAGSPKLLDFGVAKLLEDPERPGAATMLTREWGGPLTPEYAAPEQVSGGPVTTAIDVYSLGVLLYVLLAGRHPTGPGARSQAELVKAIVDTDAPRMSEAAGKTGGPRRQLRGDLDTIVAKALKKNPLERYASVAALADDIRRYLRHEPIAARPDTLAYRAAKFARRNRAALAMAMLALAASIAGAVGTWVQARATRAQRDFALRQLSRAEAVNGLNEFVLSDAAPSGKPFTVDDLLARAERIVEHQGGDQAARVDLLVEIGHQYTVGDEYAKARQLLEGAYRLSRAVPDVSTRARASCALAQALSRTGGLPRAELLLQEGLHALPAEPLYALDRVSCLERGSEVAMNRGAAAEAIARAQAAVSLLQQVPVPSELEALNASIILAGAYSNGGRYREAGAAFAQAAAQLAALGRGDTQRAGTVYNNWGVALIQAGQPRDAEKALRRAVAIQRDGTEQTLDSMMLVNYARVLHELGRSGEAADYAERGCVKAQQIGDETAMCQGLLLRTAIYRSRGDLALAGKMLADVAPRLQRILPAGHVAFATLASERALNAEAAGDLPLAMKFADQAIAIVEALVRSGRQGKDRLPLLLTRRSDIELRLGRLDAAAADAARAVDMLTQTMEPSTFSTTRGRADFALGRAREAQGRQAEARIAFQSAAENLDHALGPDHPETREARRLQQAP